MGTTLTKPEQLQLEEIAQTIFNSAGLNHMLQLFKDSPAEKDRLLPGLKTITLEKMQCGSYELNDNERTVFSYLWDVFRTLYLENYQLINERIGRNLLTQDYTAWDGWVNVMDNMIISIKENLCKE